MSGPERERHKNAGPERTRDAWYQEYCQAHARLAVLERERKLHWSDEAWRYKDLNEQLRAERKAT